MRKQSLTHASPENNPIGSNEVHAIGEDNLASISILDACNGESDVDELESSQGPAKPAADDYILPEEKSDDGNDEDEDEANNQNIANNHGQASGSGLADKEKGVEKVKQTGLPIPSSGIKVVSGTTPEVASMQATANKLPPKVPGSCDTSKVLLRNFSNLSMRSLAKAGQVVFHCHITVVEAFPFPNHKEELCWTSLLQAATALTELRATVDSVKGNMNIKRDLFNCVWTGASQVRGEMMHKACSTISHAYGLARGLESPNKLEQVIKWLVKDLKFLYPNININAITCDEDKPWQNAIIRDLIKAQWWGPKGNAKRLGSLRDNVYVNVPIPMLALVACVVECTLTGLGIRHNFDFNDMQY